MNPETDPKRRENTEDMDTSESNHNKYLSCMLLETTGRIFLKFLDAKSKFCKKRFT